MNINLRRGDDFSYGAFVKTGGVAQNLTGWTLQAVATQGAASQAVTTTVVDAAAGAAKFTILKAATAGMAEGLWQLQIRLTTPLDVSVSADPVVIKVRA